LVQLPHDGIGLVQGEEVAVRDDIHLCFFAVAAGGERANHAVVVGFDFVDHLRHATEVVPVCEGGDVGEGVDGHGDGVDGGTGSGEGAEGTEDGSFEFKAHGIREWRLAENENASGLG
jgi:hypothetical protein